MSLYLIEYSTKWKQSILVTTITLSLHGTVYKKDVLHKNEVLFFIKISPTANCLIKKSNMKYNYR